MFVFDEIAPRGHTSPRWNSARLDQDTTGQNGAGGLSGSDTHLTSCSVVIYSRDSSNRSYISGDVLGYPIY